MQDCNYDIKHRSELEMGTYGWMDSGRALSVVSNAPESARKLAKSIAYGTTKVGQD